MPRHPPDVPGCAVQIVVLVSLAQNRFVVSNDSCNTFCCNVSKMIKTYLKNLDFLCFEHINFKHLVGVTLCDERDERSVVSSYSDQIPPCFSEAVRQRSNMLFP